jgi:hypothetical protein
MLNEIPTGHFKKKTETPVTVLGAYLDNEQNYEQFQEDVITLSKNGTETYLPIDSNYILTDYDKHCFLLTNSVKWNATPEDKGNLMDGIIAVLKQVGYVNEKYELNSTSVPRNIKFTITSFDGKKLFLYFIPMDSYCYKITTA